MTPTFGQVIRTARTSIGYSQRELAKLVEIDFTYLSKLESNRACYPPKGYVMSATSALLEFGQRGVDVSNRSFTRTVSRLSQAELQGYASVVSMDAARARLSFEKLRGGKPLPQAFRCPKAF